MSAFLLLYILAFSSIEEGEKYLAAASQSFLQGDIYTAHIYLTKVLKADPDNIDALSALALIELQQNNDDNARREVAEKWSVRYNADIKPENINCQGCMSDDDCKFMFCNYCEMRKCAVEKNYATCGHCPD